MGNLSKIQLNGTDYNITDSEAQSKIASLESNKADNFSVGKGLEMTSERVLNVMLDNKPFVVAESLPATPSEGNENKIHIVPTGGATASGNEFTEYAWVNGKWEKFGEFKADIDLTEYLTKRQAEETYAKQDGKYDDMTVGTAQNLLGDKIILNDSAYRPTGGDEDIDSGYEATSIESIRGNAIAWNQLVNKGVYQHSNPGYFILNQTGYTWKFYKTEEEDKAGGIISAGILANVIKDHVYLIRANNITIDNPNDCNSYLSMMNYSSDYTTDNNRREVVNGRFPFGEKSYIAKMTYTGDIRFIINLDSSGAKPFTYTLEGLNVFDLTLIYGAGNEPSTPEQFEEDYQSWFGRPLTYEEYDEGSIRPVLATGIKTVGFNLSPLTEFEGNIRDFNNHVLFKNDCGYQGLMDISFEIETEDTTNQTIMSVLFSDGSFRWIESKGSQKVFVRTGPKIDRITGAYNHAANVKIKNLCINFVWSGKRNGEYEPHWEETKVLPITTLKGRLKGEGESVTVFPDGLKRAGDVYDEIKVENGVTKAIKRIGSVDLGSLNWMSFDPPSNPNLKAFYTERVDILKVDNDKITPNVLCHKYVSEGYADFYWGNSEKAITCRDKGNEFSSGSAFFIKDSDYLDPASLKESLKGIISYYALETPEEYILDDFSLPLVYRVDDFGTEQIIQPENSVAPTLVTRYGLNAVDTLRRLSEIYLSKKEAEKQYLPVKDIIPIKENLESLNNDIKASTDGCFIVYHRKSDGHQIAIPYWEWDALEKQGEIADGVLVLIDGQAPIIVSPTGTQMHWSKNAIAVNTDVAGDYNKAYVDYSGKTRTAAIMAKGVELFGDDQTTWKDNYAPAWCHAYDRSHDKGDGTMIGLGAGSWWLPSTAELIEIWKHKYAINKCLSVISGATQLGEVGYWSSTEYSMSYAWRLNFKFGFLEYLLAKLTERFNVRAVSAFYGGISGYVNFKNNTLDLPSNINTLNPNTLPPISEVHNIILRYNGVVKDVDTYMASAPVTLEMLQEQGLIEDNITNDDLVDLGILDEKAVEEGKTAISKAGLSKLSDIINENNSRLMSGGEPVPMVNLDYYVGVPNNWLKIYVPNAQLQNYKDQYPTLINYLHPFTGDNIYYTKDNLEIGGTNLAKNSNFREGYKGWGSLYSTQEVVEDNVYKLTPNHKTAGYLYFMVYPEGSRREVPIGKLYTVSFEVRTDSDLEVSFNYNYWINVIGGIDDATINATWINAISSRNNLITKEWKKVVFVGYNPTAIVPVAPFFAIRRSDLGTGPGEIAENYTLYVRNYKWEEGTIPTAWSPAPEDLLSKSSIWTGNQSGYDSLTKDDNTLYFITED